MQTVKKYANRKLYHVDRKRYITLEGIAALIQGGEQVQVIDNESGEDITATILAQVALQGRGERGGLPTNVLTGLIRAGGGTLSGLQRSLWSALGAASPADAEIAGRLDRLHEAGELSDAEYARMHSLLLPPAPSAEPGPAAHPHSSLELPSRRDVERLRAEVDALADAIEKLAAERGS